MRKREAPADASANLAFDPAAGDNADTTAQAMAEPHDFSTSNVVSVLLGQESLDLGLAHLPEEPDGRTTIETVNGVPCRHLNRRPGGSSFGYVYFAIDPTFKTRELSAAQIEVEYLVDATGFLRLQYDAMEGETHRSYKSVVASGGDGVSPGNVVRFTHMAVTNAWQTATFRVTDAFFRNSQNGSADFRLEVTPPEIYVRRVTVTREDGPAAMSSTHADTRTALEAIPKSGN